MTEFFRETRRMKALAFWMDGNWINNWEMDITGTPCEKVYETAKMVHFSDNLLDMYPTEPDVVAIQAVSYLGMPLIDLDGTILGHLAVMDTRPMPEEPRGDGHTPYARRAKGSCYFSYLCRPGGC